jgi:ankyrin repeat protein
MVQLLLDRGADVNASSDGGHTGHALMGTVRNKYGTIMRLLLDHGADVNVRDGYIFDQAAAQGDDTVLEVLLASGVLDENRQRFLNQALQSAARWGKPQTCQWLVDRGANVNYEGGKYGSALQAAVCEHYWPRHDTTLEVAQLLIKNGADVNLGGGEYGGALMAAICNTNGEIVKMLADAGANVNARGGELDSILQAIARHGTASTVRYFLEIGADVHVVGGKYGTALQAACYKHDLESMKLLIEHGADVNLATGKYGNCLQAAAFKKRKGNEKESVAAMEFLISHGADVNATGGKYGTALQCAARHGNLGGVKFLLNEGADVMAEGGKLGSALKAAEAQKQYHVVTFLERYIAELDAVQKKEEEKTARWVVSRTEGCIEQQLTKYTVCLCRQTVVRRRFLRFHSRLEIRDTRRKPSCLEAQQ